MRREEDLRRVVSECVSFAQVLRRLGLKQAGGSQSEVKKKVEALGISTGHFLGRGTNRGLSHRGGCPKKPYSEVLAIGTRSRSHCLRRALLESGRKYCCQGNGCPVGDEWLGKKIVLQVDHIDGDRSNNKASNLRFLCPNCHSQTDNWGKNEGGTDLTSNAKQCQNRRRKRREASGLV